MLEKCYLLQNEKWRKIRDCVRKIRIVQNDEWHFLKRKIAVKPLNKATDITTVNKKR